VDLGIAGSNPVTHPWIKMGQVETRGVISLVFWGRWKWHVLAIELGHHSIGGIPMARARKRFYRPTARARKRF
jgi:hypothetical protein